MSDLFLRRHLLLLLFLSLSISKVVESQNVIKSLPGFPGDLPFYMETGYIGVGELDEIQTFYYFVGSERSPKDDPLLLWLTGGPGCSALSGLIYEIGPLNFDYTKSRGSTRPVFKLNPYSWTKVANIIFVDEPVGTGFSYSKTAEGYNVNDTEATQDLYKFLRKWLLLHPEFQSNPLYIAGDSYSGIIAPILTLKIAEGNDVDVKPLMNLQGYILGNPATNVHVDLNSRVPFAHLKGLLSDEVYESTKNSCKGDYVSTDADNVACLDNLLIVDECISKIHTSQILEPSCNLLSPRPSGKLLSSPWTGGRLPEDPIHLLRLPGGEAIGRQWCRNYNYLDVYIWANDRTVQDVLGIRQGTVKEWLRCNASLAYTYNVNTSLGYHVELIKRGYRILIYSGDHDMVIPYISTYAWIEALNLTVADDWTPWFVNGQVAGYVTQYYEKKCRFTYATVKGGGHTAPEYKPKECFAMIDRWLAYYPL